MESQYVILVMDHVQAVNMDGMEQNVKKNAIQTAKPWMVAEAAVRKMVHVKNVVGTSTEQPVNWTVPTTVILELVTVVVAVGRIMVNVLAV